MKPLFAMLCLLAGGPLFPVAAAEDSATKPGKGQTATPAPAQAQGATNSETVGVEALIREAARSNDADEFFSTRARKMGNEMRAAYQALKNEDHSAPGFAAKSGIMAALARQLYVPGPERREVEDLDLRLNPQDSSRWLRLLERHVLAKKDKESIDAFLEALKWADLSSHRRLLRRIGPQPGIWHHMAVNAGRAEELAAALGSALARTPREQATKEAADIFEVVIKAAATQKMPSALGSLLEAVLKHQRHLILISFVSLKQLATDPVPPEESEGAARVARAVLKGVWRGAQHKTTFDGGLTNGLPPGVFAALSSWSRGRGMNEVAADPFIRPLFEKALQGDASAFVEGLAADVADYPNDEQLVSCAAVAKALQGAPLDEAFRLADRLSPQPKMRVAWRLCEIKQPAPEVVAKLAPAFIQGIEAMFQAPEFLEKRGLRLTLAEKILPWLERAGADAGIKALGPLFAKDLAVLPLGDKQRLEWIKRAQRLKIPDLTRVMAASWARDCEKTMTEGTDEGWYHEHIHKFCSLAERLDAGEGQPFVALAGDVWTGYLKAFSSHTNPHSSLVLQLCDYFIAYEETERLFGLISQIELIVRLGGGEEYEPLLWRAREGLEFLRASDRLAVPSVWVEDIPGDETSGRVHWEFMATPSNGRAVVLKRSSKTHHLKILAGTSYDSLRPVGEAANVALMGMVEVKNMPPSGYAQAMACDSSSSLFSVGGQVPYSLRKPLLDSSTGPDESVPEWDEAQFQNCGRPVSKAVSADAGMWVLTTQLMEHHAVQEGHYTQLYLVALDEHKKPLGAWSVTDSRVARRYQPEGGRMAGLSLASPFHMSSEAPPGARGRLHYIVLASPSSNEGNPLLPPVQEAEAVRAERGRLAYPVQVRLFQRQEPPVSANLPELESALLAKVGFPIRSWQLCENHPRAVFCGDDEVAVFDTDAVPWRELLRVKDPRIAQGGWVFMLNADVACFSQAQPNGSPAEFVPHVWQLRCAGTERMLASLKDCPELPLPKAPYHAEMSPHEDAVLLMSPGRENTLKLVWVDSSHSTRTFDVTLPKHDQGAWPFIAWWSGDGKKALVEDNGMQVLVERTADGLRAEEAKRGQITLAAVPQGALPGQRFFKHAWALKDGNTLVRMDDKTGMPQRAFRLTGQYRGDPLWWGRRHQSVLLQATDHDLMMVQPQEAKLAR